MLTAALVALGLLAVVFAIDAGLRVQAKRAAKGQPAVDPDSRSISQEVPSERVEAASKTEAGTEFQPILHEQPDPIEELGVDSGFI